MGTLATSSAVTLYTTPAGRTTIIQYLTLYCRGSDSGPLRLLIRSGPVAVAIHRSVGTALEAEHLDVWVVIHAGESLQADGPTAGGAGWWVTASGAELIGEPLPAAGTLPSPPRPESPEA